MFGATNTTSWVPKTNDTLDLRFLRDNDKSTVDENQLISDVSTEMGKNLKSLFTISSHISDIGFATLKQNCPNLENLGFSGALRVDDAVLMNDISQFTNLQKLDLSHARKVPETAKKNKEFYSAITKITDKGVECLLEKLPKLTEIDLSGTDITEKTLDAIVKYKNINYVRISNCWELKKDSLHDYVKKITNTRSDLKIILDKTDGTLDFMNSLSPYVHGHYYEQPPVTRREVIEESIVVSGVVVCPPRKVIILDDSGRDMFFLKDMYKKNEVGKFLAHEIHKLNI